jgi:hypothetical protein
MTDRNIRPTIHLVESGSSGVMNVKSMTGAPKALDQTCVKFKWTQTKISICTLATPYWMKFHRETDLVFRQVTQDDFAPLLES